MHRVHVDYFEEWKIPNADAGYMKPVGPVEMAAKSSRIVI